MAKIVPDFGPPPVIAASCAPFAPVAAQKWCAGDDSEISEQKP
jgi:hypothetical protein